VNGAWSDGFRGPGAAPTGTFGAPTMGQPANAYDVTTDPQLRGYGYTATPPADVPVRRSVPDLVTSRLDRVRQFEGLRGYSTRAALAVKYLAYFMIISTFSGVTQAATNGVKYASGGGKFLFVASMLVASTGAIATLFYANLRNEIVEKVRHYIFGIMLIPGMLLALLLRALQEWEWANEGSLGITLQAALPAVFLATVVLPTLVFVKEMLGIRTLHRTKMDDQESLQLWTRQDGLQR
jgi:hypothetical protein